MAGLSDDISNLIEKKVIAFKEDFLRLLTGERGLTMDSRAVDSLTVIVNENEKFVSLEAVNYIYYVIHGRRPGKFPPPNENGEWPLPYPAAKQIAEFGNIEKYRPIANMFDKMYNELIREIEKESQEVSTVYATKVLSFKNKQIWQRQ